MTKYREILRLKSLGISNTRIADSIPCSRNTVSSTWNRAAERGITWETVRNMTDAEVEQLLFVKQEEPPSDRVQPDFAYIRKELKKPGVTKKLLWTEYLEQCRLSGGVPLMYSQLQSALLIGHLCGAKRPWSRGMAAAVRFSNGRVAT